MTAERTLIVGIGSAHGDDQAGWLVIERLTEQLEHARSANVPRDVRLRTASSPADLLTCLDGPERLLVVDACVTGSAAGTVHRWEWPAEDFAQTSWSGTHDLSLADVLELAKRLDRLPSAVTVWGIELDPGLAAGPSSAAVTPPVAAAAASTADRILAELRGQAPEESPR